MIETQFNFVFKYVVHYTRLTRTKNSNYSVLKNMCVTNFFCLILLIMVNDNLKKKIQIQFFTLTKCQGQNFTLSLFNYSNSVSINLKEIHSFVLLNFFAHYYYITTIFKNILITFPGT